jgi:murein DD-endopeptidase MepM/ murein hydrolase activator NlpD
MRTAFLYLIAGALAMTACVVAAQAPSSTELTKPAYAVVDDPRDHMTDEERERIWSAISQQQARLQLPKAGERPSFRWPLRSSHGYSDPAFFRISNYVDHNAAFPNQVQDYSCGARSYDRDTGYNHQGIDISIVPDSWNLMASRQIEIIAAAPGTIIQKSDGSSDQNCRFNSEQWNAVYVQHDDGSIAWYGHMKRGSLTSKAIGARVAAGEYLGNVGSSGNSTGPHLHFEVYDAQHRLIDPYAGACNRKNTESWWESQPPYSQTRITGVSTASAPPLSSTCGADGRMETPGTLNGKSRFRPGDTLWVVANARDQPKDATIQFSVRTPSGEIWGQTTSAPAAQFFVGSIWWAGFTIPATIAFGNWMAEARLGDTSAHAPFTITADGAPIANYTDLWWNPAESGWGVNLNHQGDSLFATWFTYDADGAAMWLVMSDARLQPDGSYAGAIYRATGVPLAQINGAAAANFPLPVVGNGSFRFTSAQRGLFAYNVNGVQQQKPIERQVFSTATQCVSFASSRESLTNYQDLWWNPAEPGWGLNLSHQGETIFATWFTYGAGGRGQWLVASDVRRQPTGEFSGRIYRTQGTAFDRIAAAPAVSGSPLDVGAVSLTFSDGEHGRFDYTVDGVSQSKAITRQAFARETPLCR